MKGEVMQYLVMCIAIFISAAIGFLAGIFTTMWRMRKAIEKQSVGHLRIDRSEPDEPPRPFLELHGSTIESISQKEYVMLKVINKNYLSRH